MPQFVDLLVVKGLAPRAIGHLKVPWKYVLIYISKSINKL